MISRRLRCNEEPASTAESNACRRSPAEKPRPFASTARIREATRLWSTLCTVDLGEPVAAQMASSVSGVADDTAASIIAKLLRNDENKARSSSPDFAKSEVVVSSGVFAMPTCTSQAYQTSDDSNPTLLLQQARKSAADAASQCSTVVPESVCRRLYRRCQRYQWSR
jgi:hypothetical protein